MLIVTLECFKCAERAPCQLLLIFYHFPSVEITETCGGCGHPPSSGTYQKWHSLDHPQTHYLPKPSCPCAKASWSQLFTKCSSRKSALCPSVSPVPVVADRRLTVTMLPCTNKTFLACAYLAWRKPSLACGTGRRMASPTESFSDFYQGEVVKNIGNQQHLARRPLQPWL